MPVYKQVNHDFFKSWSAEMAYVLGFFAADGSMLRNNRGAHYIEFHITDKAVLEQMRKTMCSNHRISKRQRSPRWKPIYRLQIGSKVFFEDLSKLGFTQGKSKTLRLPVVPQTYTGDFIRGYFDGDGCVYFNRHTAKDRKSPRWIFQTRFTSGNKQFLSELQSLLHTNGLRHGYIYQKNRGFELVFSHRDSIALFRLMYNNEPRIYLRRKYEVFRRAYETLYKGCMRW